MRNKKPGPFTRPEDITKDNAAEVLEHVIWAMSMSEDVDNTQLCMLAAMKHGINALRKQSNENK